MTTAQETITNDNSKRIVGPQTVQPAPTPARDPLLRRWGRTFGPPLVLGLFLIGLWYLISYGLLDEQRRFLLRPPP